MRASPAGEEPTSRRTARTLRRTAPRLTLLRTADAIGLWLELEARCNWACQFCYNPWRFGEFAGPPRLDVDAMVRDIDAVRAAVPVTDCTLSGGEPLLVPRRDLERLVGALTERGVRTVLTTNGSLLTEDRLRGLRDAGLSSTQVSLHALEPAVHDTLTQRPGSFDAALRGAGTVAAVGGDLWLTVVVTRTNVAEVTGLVRLAHVLGAGLIVNEVTPTIGMASTEELSIVDRKGLAVELEHALAIAARLDVRMEPGSRFDLIDASPDLLAWSGRGDGCPVQATVSRLTLDSAGMLRTCNHSPYVIGSVRTSPVDALFDEASTWSDRARQESNSSCLYRERPVEAVVLGSTILKRPRARR